MPTSDVSFNIVNTKTKLISLVGNGHFSSQECLDILNEADIVVKNPPFSLFIPYFEILKNSGKLFIIIAHNQATTYKVYSIW